VFISTDQNLKGQQHVVGRKLAILVLPTNDWPTARSKGAEIAARVAMLQAGDSVEPDLGASAVFQARGTRRVINGRKDALKQTRADVPRRGSNGIAGASPWQHRSSKLVASMFLGCSWLVPSLPLLLFPQPSFGARPDR
jgi:hypothetical protein